MEMASKNFIQFVLFRKTITMSCKNKVNNNRIQLHSNLFIGIFLHNSHGTMNN